MTTYQGGLYDPEESCGGIAPDDCCGSCPDCQEALDEWRQMNGDDE